MSVGKSLKVVGVASQRETEKAIREAVKAGKLSGTGTVRANTSLYIDDVGLRHEVEDDIEL